VDHEGDHNELEVFYLIDPHNRYFMGWVDEYLEYKVNILDLINEKNDKEDFGVIPDLSITVPVLRIFYTVKHHRGRGLQKHADHTPLFVPG
jgi:hypothetical protein